MCKRDIRGGGGGGRGDNRDNWISLHRLLVEF